MRSCVWVGRGPCGRQCAGSGSTGFGLGFRNGPSRQSRRSQKRYAIEASGLYIKLRRRSDNMPYNEAPVIVGGEANRARVELLREWPASYRPAADIDDDDDSDEDVA